MFTNPLALTEEVRLTQADLTFRNAVGNSFGTFSVLSFVTNTDPWDGFIVNSSQVILINNAVNVGVHEVQLTVVVETVAAVPEPITATLSLMGVGLLGITTRRRRTV